jgi:hypothetical protein
LSISGEGAIGMCRYKAISGKVRDKQMENEREKDMRETR